MDCSLLGSSVYGILQARILEWVAIFFSRGSSDPGIEPESPALQTDSLPSELQGNPTGGYLLIQIKQDFLAKKMATHSSILAWRMPWTEEFGGLQSTGHKESDTTERLHFHFQITIMEPAA